MVLLLTGKSEFFILFLSFFFYFGVINVFDMKPRNHDQCRSLVCAACGRKDTRCKPVNATIEGQIKAEISTLYNRNDVYFPAGVCNNCRIGLYNAKNGKVVATEVRDRWNSMDFSAYRPPSRTAPCACTICKLVGFTCPNLEKTEQVDVPRAPKEDNQNEA